MIDYEKIFMEARAMKDWLVNTRRRLHAIPEPGDAEHETQEALCGYLDSLGIPYERHRTSVVGFIEGKTPGKVVALRADMDALPVDEPEERPYRSRNTGYMHACGHDAHMTIALGVANYFAAHRDSLSGGVKFLFQPAEETSGGAKNMIDDGCLENPHVDWVTGLHVQSYLPVGHIEIKYGAINGSSDVLKVTVKGLGAHAAYPDTGIDAIMIAGKVLDGLHSVVSRNVSPLDEAVVTLGTIQGGTRNNIIADKVVMMGTIRTTDPEVRKKVGARVKAIVEGIPVAFGGSGEVEIRAGYPALINNPAAVDVVADVGGKLLSPDAVHWKEKPSLGVEDFSYFLLERPGVFYHLGCGNKARNIMAPLHAREFDIDEDCLSIGVAMQVALTQELLEKEPPEIRPEKDGRNANRK
jgi:amidohydrolase